MKKGMMYSALVYSLAALLLFVGHTNATALSTDQVVQETQARD
jgi:hypothetical protein